MMYVHSNFVLNHCTHLNVIPCCLLLQRTYIHVLANNVKLSLVYVLQRFAETDPLLVSASTHAEWDRVGRAVAKHDGSLDPGQTAVGSAGVAVRRKSIFRRRVGASAQDVASQTVRVRVAHHHAVLARWDAEGEGGGLGGCPGLAVCDGQGRSQDALKRDGDSFSNLLGRRMVSLLSLCRRQV